MGVKGFSKAFAPSVTTLKKLKGKKAAIDASVMIYQSALGMKKVNGLTDTDGNPTLHINVIHSRILSFIANNINQHWVFDYHEKNYVCPDKALEIKKRNARKKEAQKKIDNLRQTKTIKQGKSGKSGESDKKRQDKEDELFSDSEDEQSDNKQNTQEQIDKLEKITFSVTDTMFNDCKYLLNTYGIQWSIAPKDIEAEYVCAELCNQSDCDFVYTTDIDALLYKAPILVRPIRSKGKKILQKYILSDILHENNITQSELIKIGMILGTDHAPKTPKIGPKTVIKKFKDVELTKEQIKGSKVFVKPLTLNNKDVKELTKEKLYKQINSLLCWLAAKNFNVDRVKKQIRKVYKDFK